MCPSQVLGLLANGCRRLAYPLVMLVPTWSPQHPVFIVYNNIHWPQRVAFHTHVQDGAGEILELDLRGLVRAW